MHFKNKPENIINNEKENIASFALTVNADFIMTTTTEIKTKDGKIYKSKKHILPPFNEKKLKYVTEIMKIRDTIPNFSCAYKGKHSLEIEQKVFYEVLYGNNKPDNLKLNL